MHKPYSVLRGITLPGETVIITGRVFNWLNNASDKIKPASCIVETLGEDALNLGNVFITLGKYLMESAGINVIVDSYEKIHKILVDQYPIVSKDCIQIVDSSVDGFDWSKYPEYTVLKVADKLMLRNAQDELILVDFTNEKDVSIFASWNIAFMGVLFGDRIVLDFANVRTPDIESSGRESFMQICDSILDFCLEPSLTRLLKILSDICSTIKRGGFRRHGAMTTTLESTSTLIDEYLKIPFSYLSHVKKGVLIRHETVLGKPKLVSDLMDYQNKGEIFFEKYLGYSHNQELRSNVCRAIALIPGDQCLISVVNFGMVKTYKDIPKAYEEVTRFLIDVHELQIELGHKKVDRQIAVSVAGLANMLRNFNTDYSSFIQMLCLYNFAYENNIDLRPEYENDVNFLLISHIEQGINIASSLCNEANMRSGLAIEPGESCVRRYKDCRGFDIVPNISPPDVVYGVGIERRQSETGVYNWDNELIYPEFNYGSDIDVASRLTEAEHFALWDGFNVLQNRRGQGHGACFEMWYPWTWDNFIKWWYSSLKFVYYNRRVGTKHLEKGTQIESRSKLQERRSMFPNFTSSEISCDVTEPSGCSSCGD